MRPLLLALALSPALLQAQTHSGTYRPEKGAAAAWQINDHLTLMWNGAPYLPVGLRIHGTQEEIDAAKAAGIQDVIVELPRTSGGWPDAIAALEKAGMRYLIALDTLSPAARGIAIEPQAYRVGGITEDTVVEFPLPGVTTALAILVTQRDRSVQQVKRVEVKDGQFRLPLESVSRVENVLLVYPEMENRAQPDYWEGFDRHRDELLTALKKSNLGPGLRGLINPLGASIDWRRRNDQFVPTSGYFLMEFKAHLIERYRNIDTAQRAWSMSASDVTTWEGMIRLVPLWTRDRGVSQLWDPQTDRLYVCDMKRSSIWNDINSVIQTAGARRVQRLTTAIKQAADVPIIQDWAGWSGPYEGNSSGLNGIGMLTSGTGRSEVAGLGSRATSSILRWRSPGWLVATEVEVDGSEDAPAKLPLVLDDLGSMGARGWFVKSSKKEVIAQVAAENTRRSADSSLAQLSPVALYFPENAGNPASAQQLPGGKWWLPSPASGNRLDFGTAFSGYVYNDGTSSFTALWTSLGPTRVRLRMSDPKAAKVSMSDGTDPKVKVLKNGLEVTLTSMPLIVEGTSEIPIPEPAFLETGEKFKGLMALAQQAHVDASEDNYMFSDALKAFERDPAGSYFTLRTRYFSLTQKLSRWTWMEAERTSNSNFSEIMPLSGGSGGSVITLRSPISTDNRGFFAEYNIQARSPDDLEIWIAARIPADQRKFVKVAVSDQTLILDSEPVSPYSSGFAWYRVGVTKLKQGTNKLTIQVISPDGADMAFDAIVLYPGSFVPSGVTMPEVPLPKK